MAITVSNFLIKSDYHQIRGHSDFPFRVCIKIKNFFNVLFGVGLRSTAHLRLYIDAYIKLKNMALSNIVVCILLLRAYLI